MLLVQYFSLYKNVNKAFKNIHYMRIIVAIILGTVCSVWLKNANLNSFFTLVLSSVLFWGVYCGYLFMRKESMVTEIWNMLTSKVKVIKKTDAK